jgi:RND family efflux transporter MFP subunit
MKFIKFLIPVFFIGIGVVIAAILIALRPQVKPSQPESKPLAVEVVDVSPKPWRHVVISHGTVRPQREISLVSEVHGRIEWVSPTMEAGMTFKQGEVLFEIDRTDYQLAMARAQASVMQSEAAMAMEDAQAAVARREWDSLSPGQEPNPLTVREPQLAEAKARLEAAKADLEQARINLDRCSITAPFAGAVMSKQADLGQYVREGGVLGTLHSTDIYEVRLPVRLSDLRFIPLDIGVVPDEEKLALVDVTLEGELGGRTHRWEADVVQFESDIDGGNRMATLITRISEPLQRGDDIPIPSGLFVRAEIAGIGSPSILEIPRIALRKDEDIYVVDADSKLRIRDVRIVQSLDRTVLVEPTLSEGDRVVISAVGQVLPGQQAVVTDEAVTAPGK